MPSVTQLILTLLGIGMNKEKEKWVDAEKKLYVIYRHGIRPVKLKVTL